MQNPTCQVGCLVAMEAAETQRQPSINWSDSKTLLKGTLDLVTHLSLSWKTQIRPRGSTRLVPPQLEIAKPRCPSGRSL